jgi:hypothetical protein
MPRLPTFVLWLSLTLLSVRAVVVPPGTECLFGNHRFVIVSVTSTAVDSNKIDGTGYAKNIVGMTETVAITDMTVHDLGGGDWACSIGNTAFELPLNPSAVSSGLTTVTAPMLLDWGETAGVIEYLLPATFGEVTFVLTHAVGSSNGGDCFQPKGYFTWTNAPFGWSIPAPNNVTGSGCLQPAQTLLGTTPSDGWRLTIPHSHFDAAAQSFVDAGLPQLALDIQPTSQFQVVYSKSNSNNKWAVNYATFHSRPLNITAPLAEAAEVHSYVTMPGASHFKLTLIPYTVTGVRTGHSFQYTLVTNDFRVQAYVPQTGNMIIDLSEDSSPGNLPASWRGVWFTKGEVRPLGPGNNQGTQTLAFVHGAGDYFYIDEIGLHINIADVASRAPVPQTIGSANPWLCVGDKLMSNGNITCGQPDQPQCYTTPMCQGSGLSCAPSQPKPASESCDDGNPCTGPDICWQFASDTVCKPGPDICTTPSPTPAPSPTSAPTSSPTPFPTNAKLNGKTNGACRRSSQQAVPYALAAILGLAQFF